MKILESFISKSYANEIESYINSPNIFHWSFFDQIAAEYWQDKQHGRDLPRSSQFQQPVSSL